MSSQVLYISGYGRSGSTVLGTLLGSSPDAMHVGEVSSLFEELGLRGRICSCGSVYTACPFWSDILAGDMRTWARHADLTNSIEQVGGLPDLLWHTGDAGRRQAYGSLQKEFMRRVRERAGVDVIVDSSKSAWMTVGRFLALERYANEDVFVVHLVRNRRDTMRSLVRTGSNWALEGRNAPKRAPAARAAFGWTAVNRLAERVGRELPAGRFMTVQYEDLIERPAETLGNIGRFANLDLDSVIQRVTAGDEFQVGHVVGGNRVRFAKSIGLTPSSRPETKVPTA